MDEYPVRRLPYLVLSGTIVAMLTGLVVRIYQLDATSLRLEETFAILFAHHPSMALQGNQPPGYIGLLAGWIALFTDGIVSVRVLSVLIGLAAIPAMVLYARRVAGDFTGIISGALLAGWPLHIMLSRQDGALALVVTIELWALYCAARLEDPERPAKKFAAALAVLNIAGILASYFFVFVIAAEILLLLFFGRKDALRRRGAILAIAAPFFVLVLAAPLVLAQFAVIREQMKSFPLFTTLAGAPFANWLAEGLFGAPWPFVWPSLDGIGAGDAIGVTLSVLGAALLFAGTHRVVFDKTAGRIALAGVAYGAVFLAAAISVVVPIWSRDLLIVLLVPFVPLAALALDRFGRAGIAAGLAFALVTMTGALMNTRVAAGEGVGAWEKPPEWQRAVVELLAELRPGDEIFVAPGWIAEGVRYHARYLASLGKMPAVELPLTEVSYDFYNRDAPGEIKTATPGASRYWLIRTTRYGSESATKWLLDHGLQFVSSKAFWNLFIDLYTEPPKAEASAVADLNAGSNTSGGSGAGDPDTVAGDASVAVATTQTDADEP
ncbi:glycosyltransferase family 39 protein [bacterium]|nr:glycosyltransferase family 39 protein [bacterium]